MAIETYLRSRAISLSMPPCLRFHPNLRHPSGTYWPAMVAQMKAPGGNAIHRTWLAKDGSGKAPIADPKMLLGSCYGGAIQLYKPGPTLLISEGIENALSGTQATGYQSWAAGSARMFKNLTVPACIRHVIILADNDEAGIREADHAADRWRRYGKQVSIDLPDEGDWNDMLKVGRSADIGDSLSRSIGLQHPSPRCSRLSRH